MRTLNLLINYGTYPIVKKFSIVQRNAEAICEAIAPGPISVVGMGTSGAILISAILQIRPGWFPVLLRKPDGEETTHRSYVEGPIDWERNPILVVDDLVCSGWTMENIAKVLRDKKLTVDYLAVLGGTQVTRLFPNLKILMT